MSVEFGPGIIDDDGEMDLFADGEAADWLLDIVLSNGVLEGRLVDCYALLNYGEAPVGRDDKTIMKASLLPEAWVPCGL